MRYAQATPTAVEATEDYRVEDGVLIDRTEAARPNTRQFNEMTRYHAPTPVERLAEEVEWAARSGPVVIKRPARRVA